MKNKIFNILLIVICTAINAQTNSEKPIKLFFLGGQSNMDGYGLNKELPEELNKEFKNVWIFHGNPTKDGIANGGTGVWAKLQPGHGVGFKYNEGSNMLSQKFGLELSFALALQEKYPDEKIAIIKYSKGGTSIDSLAASYFGCWEPNFRAKKGINQYDHFLNTVKLAFKTSGEIKKKNEIFEPMGILWMQGESDAEYDEEIANRYYGHLNNLMNLIRAAFHKDDIPIVLGKISDSGLDEDGIIWDYGDIIQYAQEKFVKEDKNAAIVRSTKHYKYSDQWHYDSNGYINLGKKFAEKIIWLESN